MSRSHRSLTRVLVLGVLAGCGPSDHSGGDASSANDARSGVDARAGDDAASSPDAPPGADAGADASTDAASAPDGSGGALPIGEWTDAPGECPAGTHRVDLRSNADLSNAARGESPFDGDGPGTCYFIHNGTYSQNGSVLMWFQHGGTAAQPIYFVGESRDGVVLHARATVQTGTSNLVIENLTFDLTGYSNGTDAFNTLDLLDSSNVTVSHVTFTGDCTVGHQGGHLETTGATHILIEACLIENYGACGPSGRLDHGIYLSAGSDITVRNNVIRGNSSRGIQLYTASGVFGTLSHLVIEQNRIYNNGHDAYEDGIVINGDAAGTIDDVAIRHNLIYDNYYSGVRFVGTATTGIVIEHNTFSQNGAASTTASPSQINVDSAGAAAADTVTGNIFGGTTALVDNGCYDAASRGLSIHDNLVQTAPSPLPACVSAVVAGDPLFVDPSHGDFHTRGAMAASYGAYAP